MSTYLKYQSPAMQFVAFMGMAAGFYLVSIILYGVFFSNMGPVFTDKNAVITAEAISRFKVYQLVSSIISFVLPGLLFGYFSSPKAFDYVGLRNRFSPVLVALCIVLILAIQPFAGWLANLNAKISFGSMQKLFQEAEALNDRVMKIFLEMKNPAGLFVNLFIMAVLPAIGEELFFRGALQRALLRWTKIPWVAILLSSSFFALLHLSPFKFLPIFVLGCMLGTVYYVTRNLWYNILLHFLNNTLAVLSVYYGSKSETLKKLSDDSIQFPVYTAIISLAVTFAIIYYMKAKSNTIIPASVMEDDNDYLAV